MSDRDDHIQHTWTLTNTDNDEITINLWTDDYTVHITGGPDHGTSSEQGRTIIEQQLLPKYIAAGYSVQTDYAVNDPEVNDDAP